jgi:PAS domain S-box-containing protein
MFQIDINGNYIAHKGTHEDLFFRLEDYFGKTIYDMLPKEVADQCLVNIEKALSSNKPENFEFQLLNNNEISYYEARMVQCGENEVLTIVREITENKKAQQNLIKEKELFQTYLDIAGTIIVAINADQEVTLINKKGCEILKREKNEIVGRNWFNNFIPERMREELKIFFDKMILRELEGKEYYENSIITQTGEERTIAWHNTILTDNFGKVIGTLSSGMDITDSIKVNKELIKTKEQFQSLAESALVGILIIQNNKIQYINKTTSEILGYSKKEIEKWSYSEIFNAIHPDDREYVIEQLQRKQSGIKNGVIPHYSLRINTQNNEIRWIELFSKTIDFYGKPADFITCIDITESKKIEESIRDKERRYQALFERSNDALFIIGLDMIHIDVNQNVVDLFGYAREELIGMPINKLVVPSEYDNSVDVLKKLLSGESLPIYERKFRKKDGTEFFAEVNVSLVYDEQGNPLYVQSILRDISDRKQALEELKISRNRLAMAVEASGAGIYDHFVPVEEGVYHSGRWVEILGYKRDELPSPEKFMQWLTKQIHPDDLPLLSNEYSEFIQNPSAKYNIEVRLKHKSGRWIHVQAMSKALERDENGYAKHIIGVMVDITERKQSEESLKKYNEEMELYIDILTHDLKNYHAAGKTYLDIILEDFPQNDKKNFLIQSKANFIRANALINDVSVLMKQKLSFSYPLQPIKLNTALNNVQSSLEEFFPNKRINIKSEKINYKDLILADSLFEQLILNILTNAVKNDPHEIINIEIEKKSINNEKILLTIADYGSGIHPNDREGIFERFKIFRKTGKGSGLGLFIIKTLVERYNGKIWIEDRIQGEYTQGTKFCIEFPCCL